MGSRLVIGCGYLGHRVARHWLAAGDDVTVLTRSVARAEALQGEGFAALVQDIAAAWRIGPLPDVDTVLFAVGYDRGGSHSMHDVYVAGFQEVLTQISGDPRVIYISSTGVYGDAAGEWMDEAAVCEPVREGGRHCLAAERLLVESPWAAKAIILRPAGIYGPQRVPNLETLRRGEPLNVNPDGWLNLIHVEDLAAIVGLLAASSPQHVCYNVTDGNPVMRRDYYDFLAQRFELPPVQFEGAGQRSVGRRGGASKRVSNRRLMDEFQPTLRFPSYREGLVAELG